MTFTQLFTDSFSRANASAWGDGWIDPGAQGSIASDQGVVGANATGYNGVGLVYRPTSDGNPRDGQISINLPAAEPASMNGGILAQTRLQPTASTSTGYMIAVNFFAGDFQLYTNVAGVATELGSIQNFTYNSAHTYNLTFSSVGINPTNLIATLTDTTTNTVVASFNTTDNTAALQSLSSGVFGVSSFGVSTLVSNITTYSYASSSAATAITISPTSATIVPSGTQAFSVNVNGTLNSSVTLVVTPVTTIGTLSPSTLSFVGTGAQPAAQNVTLTAPGSSGSGTLTGTHTESGGSQTLTDFASVPVTVSTSALSVGQLTATPTQSVIALSLSAAAAGGSGSGYRYNIYRGTDPNFTANSSTLLATVSSMPYTDSTALTGVEYYYGLVANDSAANTVNSYPAGLGTVTTTFLMYTPAQLQGPALALAALGDSITNGMGVSNNGTVLSPTMPYFLITKLKRLLGIRSITATNQGFDGHTTTDFLPATNTDYASAKTAMTALLAATPTALPVFSIMLGTNDSSQSGANNGSSASPLPASQYSLNMQAILTQLLMDFPTCKIVLHKPTWYSPNTGATGAVKQQISLSALASYTAVLQGLPGMYATSHPNQVFLGDTFAYQYFAQNYQAELQSEAGSDGSYRIHPMGTVGTNGLIGTQSLGEMHAEAIANALYGAVSAGIPNPWTHY